MLRRTPPFRSSGLLVAFLLIASGLGVRSSWCADTTSGQPTSPKARSTFADALEWLKRGDRAVALDEFRKASKQDGGRCGECLSRAYTLAMSMGDYKAAADIARDWLQAADTDAAKGLQHFRIGVALQQQGIVSKKDKWFTDSCDEFKTAMQLLPKYGGLHYPWGVSLSYLHQDDAARAEFKTFLDEDKDNPAEHERAQRYLARIELARARMAPPFKVNTLDGQLISMDSLAGKVVLIDFWATWCGPCRNALPHIQKISRKFAGQPLVILSVSLDKDMEKWRKFVNDNQMTWMQYRDGGFDGSVARLFGVNAIPATFSIDADGVLEDQHVGDADIEGKLKKMLARASEMKDRRPLTAASPAVPEGTN